MGISKIGLFNQALLGKWLWRFGKEATHLWRQVIATKYGEDSGGWCIRVVKGTHGCGLWKNIRKGANNFFSRAVCSGRGQSYSVLTRPLEWSYSFEGIILGIVCMCCGSGSSDF